MSVDASAQTPMERCELLGSYGEESGHLTRRFASSAMQQVNEIVKTWMRAAGMNVEQDNIGNLIARYEANRTKAKTFDFSAKRGRTRWSNPLRTNKYCNALCALPWWHQPQSC